MQIQHCRERKNNTQRQVKALKSHSAMQHTYTKHLHFNLNPYKKETYDEKKKRPREKKCRRNKFAVKA